MYRLRQLHKRGIRAELAEYRALMLISRATIAGYPAPVPEGSISAVEVCNPSFPAGSLSLRSDISEM